MGLKEKLHNFKEKNKDKKWLPAFSELHTFLYLPNETTHGGLEQTPPGIVIGDRLVQ